MNRRVVLLCFCLLMGIASLKAQSIPQGVVTAFKNGNSQELGNYLETKVELVLENRSDNMAPQVAKERMAAFFSGNKVKGFTVNHEGERDESSFIVGTLNTVNGNFRVNCFFRKVANKCVIHQIRIDKINE